MEKNLSKNEEIKKIAGMIDHTLLKQDATIDGVKRLCNEAINNNFCSVCINPSYVPICKELLKETPVKVCTVIGPNIALLMCWPLALLP